MTRRPTTVPPHQGPVAPTTDLRDMLRAHVIGRSLDAMERAAERRHESRRSGQVESYCATIRQAVAGFYGTLPCGPAAPPVIAREVSRFERVGYRLENVLFDAFPGWEVNATVYVPLDFAPPFPAVIIPVGHSGKQFASYQLPAQYFARAGYLAITFDPPGQAGEKQTGNDHFVDGVRCYLVGQTSSRYFVGDALRCVDYVISRPDVDAERGVAMTGVSGGGTTTTLATLLDQRITVAGPSCCLTPLADLDITQCYAGCPETHMWRRYAEGVDELDLVAAACPTPVLLMAGALDEVFHIEDTRRLATEAAAFYAQAGAGDRFRFFVDDGGHGYSLAQAREFTRFMDDWLLGIDGRPLPEISDPMFSLDPDEMLHCHPRQDVNMHTLALTRADELGAARDRSQTSATILAAARAIAQAEPPSPTPGEPPASSFQLPTVNANEPFQIWTHNWQQVCLTSEPGIELPATLLLPTGAGEGQPCAAILHFDDGGRNRLLYRQGLLARASGFLDREADHQAVLSVDLRGWGDSAPALYPYEMAGWGGVDRYLAYATAALGDPILSMRVRDGLAVLGYLRSRAEIDGARITVTGCGLGGLVALHVAAADGRVRGVVTWDALVSFRALLETPHYRWPADAFLPNVLQHYDLPELVAVLAGPSCAVRILNPRDGEGLPLPAGELDRLNAELPTPVYRDGAEDQDVIGALRDCLGGDG